MNYDHILEELDQMQKGYEKEFSVAKKNFDETFAQGKVTAALEIQVAILKIQNKEIEIDQKTNNKTNRS
jgi:hypothetical protein